MIIMRYSTRRTCIGVLAAILLLFLLMVAQSVTASDEQGGTPQTLTPMPERTTIPIGPAPLTLTKTVSTDAVLPGQSFAYTLRIATSREQARAEVRDILDRGVEVLGIESESGACTSAGIIICTVQVKAQEPATILITVRAHATVAPDTWLAAQALAQDDRDFTAASERVSVRVVAPPPVMSAPVAAARLLLKRRLPGRRLLLSARLRQSHALHRAWALFFLLRRSQPPSRRPRPQCRRCHALPAP